MATSYFKPHGLILAPFNTSPSYFTYTVVLALGVTQMGLSFLVISVEPGAHATLAKSVSLASDIRLNAQSLVVPSLPPPPGV